MLVLAGAAVEEEPVLAGVLGVLLAELEPLEQPAIAPAQISAAMIMESVFFIVFVLSIKHIINLAHQKRAKGVSISK